MARIPIYRNEDDYYIMSLSCTHLCDLVHHYQRYEQIVADNCGNIAVLVSPLVHHEFDHIDLEPYRAALTLTNGDTEGIMNRLTREANNDQVHLERSAADLILGLALLRQEILEISWYFRSNKHSENH